MAQPTAGSKKGGKTFELATFYLGESLFGMDILHIQEINKIVDITAVPKAPDYVMGIINLRGRIVTVIDLGRKLGLSPTVMSEGSRNIIIDSKDEFVGLLVDRIADVASVEEEKLLPAPANVKGAQGKFFTGVYRAEHDLIAVLDVEAVLATDEK